MADPKLHRRGAPAGWINAREIAAATGFRIQAVLQMLSSKDHMKREPTIWTRVKEYKWKDMPGGGRTKAAVWEEYEAFPGLSWPYRCQTVTDPVFFRYGGSDDFCLRAHIGEGCHSAMPRVPRGVQPVGASPAIRVARIEFQRTGAPFSPRSEDRRGHAQLHGDQIVAARLAVAPQAPQTCRDAGHHLEGEEAALAVGS